MVVPEVPDSVASQSQLFPLLGPQADHHLEENMVVIMMIMMLMMNMSIMMMVMEFIMIDANSTW